MSLLRNPVTRFVKRGINAALGTIGYEVRKKQLGGSYIDAAETVRAAQERGQSVRDYVEDIWDTKGYTERVIEEMKNVGSLVNCDRICEIGPGTGRYLELIIQQTSPRQYDIYETADDWAAWLADRYAPTVVRQPADGRTLQHTPDKSCGLIHAHGVFVYLPLLQAFEYFAEMARVCAPEGYIAFDFYTETHFTLDIINRWLASPDRFPVILPRHPVLEYFENFGFRLIHEFENKHAHSYSHYTILQRRKL